MSIDLPNIIHQRILFAGKDGYTKQKLYDVLQETYPCSMQEIRNNLHSLVLNGTIYGSAGKSDTIIPGETVYRLAAYLGEKQ